MSTKVLRRPMVDPVAAAQKFKDDLAAMNAGKPTDAPIKQRMMAKNFGEVSFKFRRWSAELPEHQTLEHTLDPTFWAAQSEIIMGHDKLNPKGRGDIIEIRKPDTGLYAELLVVEVGTGYIKAMVIKEAEPEAVAVPEEAPFTTRWNVGKKMHEVIRKADGQVLASNFQSKPAALAWITDHIAKMAA